MQSAVLAYQHLKNVNLSNDKRDLALEQLLQNSPMTQ